MLPLGMFVLTRRCHTRPCSVNQIIAGRQIPRIGKRDLFSFSVGEETSRLLVPLSRTDRRQADRDHAVG